MMRDDTPSRGAGSIVRRTPWPQSSSAPVVTPLSPSVVYASADADHLDAQYEGGQPGYTYAREGHPNADVLARKIDWLEGVTPDMGAGLVVGSGMAAVGMMFLALLKPGDHIVAADQLYGRSLRMLSEDLPRLGYGVTFADASDADAIAAAVTEQTRIIHVETVSNPTLRIADMAGIAAVARTHGCLLAVDNTFTTPRAFRPFDHGADIVVHSVTKLLAGHSDVTLGYVAARTQELMAAITTSAITFGATPSPFDCWLAERGLHTFELRYDQAERNAAELAEFLCDAPGVRRVLFPGRADHPDARHRAGVLGNRTANMVSFELEGGRAEANDFVRAATQIPFAPTLGDVATTLSHPASSSHRALTPDARAALGITEGFFRVSVGVEDIELLKSEFAVALRAATAGA